MFCIFFGGTRGTLYNCHIVILPSLGKNPATSHEKYHNQISHSLSPLYIYIYTLCIYTHHSIFPLCLYCIDIYIYKHTRSSHRIISPKIPPGGLSSDCHGDILPIIAAVLKITSRNWLMNFIGYEFRITRFFFHHIVET